MKRYSVILLLLFSFSLVSGQSFRNEYWNIEANEKGITRIESIKDPYHANLLNDELGDILLSYKMPDGIWMKLNINKRTHTTDAVSHAIIYTDSTISNALSVKQIFQLEGEYFQWRTEIVNQSEFPVHIGDLAYTIPWKGRDNTPEKIFEQSFTKHTSIAGDGSFLYFTRHGGMAPHFLLTPQPGTQLEYFDQLPQTRKYQVYVYSQKTGEKEQRGTWRQAHTAGLLAPSGEEGDRLDVGFTFHIADSYDDLRDKIYKSGLIDIQVVPGLTLPITQTSKFALRSLHPIDSIIPEYLQQTAITSLGRNNEYNLYEVRFDRLGENKLTIWFDNGRKTYLEFFSCESPEILLKKRSAFMVNRQQFREPDKWYDGLYGVYDMKNDELRGPDNPDFYDEILTYFLASDDPILGKAPFIASKNAVFPDDAEIESLEYHIDRFVWGKLQRTDKEAPHPYGIYGTPNWYINRHPELRQYVTDYKLDRMRVWRTYDYPHVIMLYYHMYQIAKNYPDKTNYLNAAGYLERAYGTAMAFFQYPTELLGEYYETFKWGNYNELLLVDLMEALIENGQRMKAEQIRTEWEKKAKYFIYDDPYPFRSEYALDRTAFESSYALAKYAALHEMKPDQNLWFDQNENKWYSHPEVTKEHALAFMDKQHYANLSCRGVLENQWHQLGSDFVYASDGNGLTYMSRMGGWGILDYGFLFASDPHPWLRLGYASYLASFGLINSGTKESNYGYWYPGREKDGALGQGYTAVKYGRPWIGTEEARGPWRYCGEGDLGMCAVTRMATTILTHDPIFGWNALGGILTENESAYSIIPDDGARIRFTMIDDEKRLRMELERDHWSAITPILVSKDLQEITLSLENSTGTKHSTTLKIESDSNKSPQLLMDNKKINSRKDKYGNYHFSLPVAKDNHTIVLSYK